MPNARQTARPTQFSLVTTLNVPVGIHSSLLDIQRRHSCRYLNVFIMPDIWRKKLAAREQNGGLSPRSGLMGHSWQFPSGTSHTSASLASWSSSPSSTAYTRTSGSPEGLGYTWGNPEPLLTAPPASSVVEGAAAREPAVEVYRLSDKHAEMTERWPAGLLVASKALIADVTG